MNWYNLKIATEPETFEDRNLINRKVHKFQDISKLMIRLSEVVFQDKVAAKNINFKILSDKALSSYPLIRDMLIEADRICLDSPWKFANICKEASVKMNNMVKTLELERESFSENYKEQLRRKGWWIDDKAGTII